MKTNIKYDQKLASIREQVEVLLRGKKRMGNKINDVMDIISDMRDWTYNKTREAYLESDRNITNEKAPEGAVSSS